jgi:hypothetical protein
MTERTNEEIWDRLVALSDRIADLERRANIDHLSDSPPPHYDRYWRIALPSYMVAALEGEQS